MEQMTFHQTAAFDFGRKVLDEKNAAQALDAYNNLDNAFAGDVDNRQVDHMMQSLERLLND